MNKPLWPQLWAPTTMPSPLWLTVSCLTCGQNASIRYFIRLFLPGICHINEKTKWYALGLVLLQGCDPSCTHSYSKGHTSSHIHLYMRICDATTCLEERKQTILSIFQWLPLGQSKVWDHLRKVSCESKENMVSIFSIKQKNDVVEFRLNYPAKARVSSPLLSWTKWLHCLMLVLSRSWPWK